MPAGDINSVIAAVGSGSSQTIRPGSSGPVWQVKQVASSGSWILYQTDGTISIPIARGRGEEMLDKREIIVTYGVYLRLTNISGGLCNMSHSYVVLK